MNHHVYKYYRWKAFLAMESKRWMAYEFNAQWAEDERIRFLH